MEALRSRAACQETDATVKEDLLEMESAETDLNKENSGHH